MNRWPPPPTNDAEKAFLSGLTKIDGDIRYYTFSDAEFKTIRTALANSAKVDGLLEALELIRDAAYGEASSLRREAKAALQRFNEEV